MFKLLQKHHYDKNYFNSVRGAIAPPPPVDPPLANSRNSSTKITIGAMVLSVYLWNLFSASLDSYSYAKSLRSRFVCATALPSTMHTLPSHLVGYITITIIIIIIFVFQIS